MASKTRLFSRIYHHHLDDDKDVEDECNNKFKRPIYIEMLRYASNSGIQKVNPRTLAEKTFIPLAYVQNFLVNPNSNLFFFDTTTNVLLLKKHFHDSVKIMGIPASFIGGIVNEFYETKNCPLVWQIFFRENSQILQKIYEKYFNKIVNSTNLSNVEKQAAKIITNLFEIKQEVLGLQGCKKIYF